MLIHVLRHHIVSLGHNESHLSKSFIFTVDICAFAFLPRLKFHWVFLFLTAIPHGHILSWVLLWKIVSFCHNYYIALTTCRNSLPNIYLIADNTSDLKPLKMVSVSNAIQMAWLRNSLMLGNVGTVWAHLYWYRALHFVCKDQRGSWHTSIICLFP